MPALEISDRHQLAATDARAFVWFGILFNCRFYYPIYAVFFLDLGLSVEQFAVLNAVWAATALLAWRFVKFFFKHLLNRLNIAFASSHSQILATLPWIITRPSRTPPD